MNNGSVLSGVALPGDVVNVVNVVNVVDVVDVVNVVDAHAGSLDTDMHLVNVITYTCALSAVIK